MERKKNREKGRKRRKTIIETSTDPLSELAGTAKIDDFDGRSFGIAEKNVLGFEIAMDDAQFRCRQEEKCCA